MQPIAVSTQFDRLEWGRGGGGGGGEREREGGGKREEESLFRLKSVSLSRSVRLLCETLAQKIVQSCGRARSQHNMYIFIGNTCTIVMHT